MASCSGTAKTFIFFYIKVGNMAMIGFSGAHTYTSQLALFDEASVWAVGANPDYILLLTHWNSAGTGCDDATTASAVYRSLQARPACASLAPKFKYFEGHKHCNQVMEADVGFMVAAQGMLDLGCENNLEFPVVDTFGGTFKVYNFLVQSSSVDNYEALMTCFAQNGVQGCYSMATLWSNSTM